MARRSQTAARSVLEPGQKSGRRLRSTTAQPRALKVKAPAQSPLHLDRVIHERLRLGIASALAVNQQLTFYELKTLLQTTDGNLIVHARKLEDAGYITSHKSVAAGVSRTEYRITGAGRRALEKYVAHMEAILGAVKS